MANSRGLALGLSLALLAGCAAPPAARVGAARTDAGLKAAPIPKVAAPATAATTVGASSLVPAAALSAIGNAGKQAAATTLATELAVQLRTDRTMRDGELLSGSSLIGGDGAAIIGADGASIIGADGASLSKAGAALRHLMKENGDEKKEGNSGKKEGNSGKKEDNGGKKEDEGRDRATRSVDPKFAKDEKDDEQKAKSGWDNLPSEARTKIATELAARETSLHAKLNDKLKRKAKSYVRGEADRTENSGDGGKIRTAKLAVGDKGGKTRDLTLRRIFDAKGSAIQVAARLTGTDRSGIGVTCDRTRTNNPDGTITMVVAMTLTIDGRDHLVRWRKTIGKDGRLQGEGAITRPDGSTVALASTGGEDGLETVTATDASSGLTATLTSDAAAGSATATLDAGGTAKSTVTLDADEEDDDEGDVADRAKKE